MPMNGGIWKMCVSLEGKLNNNMIIYIIFLFVLLINIFLLVEEEVSILSRAGFPKEPLCTNYLADDEDDEQRGDWQHRKYKIQSAIKEDVSSYFHTF